MKLGTKSVLFGAHQFLLHPCFVAWAWTSLFGFPWDPRLWFSFFLHDLGYIGMPNMDGEEGETHPILGAEIMGCLFGAKWYYFTLLHSRFLARRMNMPYSRLCLADKLATSLTPAWLYLPLVRLFYPRIKEIQPRKVRENRTALMNGYMDGKKVEINPAIHAPQKLALL